MATYIDLNPVRAGLTQDPGTWRWCGYGEAMSGKAPALAGLEYITGLRGAGGAGKDTGKDSARGRERSGGANRRRNLRVLAAYRQLLGIAGRERTREDGTVVRRGVNEALRRRWETGRGARRELLLRRIRNLSAGVIVGSRRFIDEWFAGHRDWFGGGSAQSRKTGARPIGKRAGWRGIFNLREFRKPG